MKVAAGPHVEVLRLENPAHGGTVIAHRGASTVLVHYGLPGELAEVHLQERRRGVEFGRVLRLQEASELRVEPRCPHFGTCGGCHWQHAAYELQLQLKLGAVGDLWRRAGLRLPEDTGIHGMTEPWRYRIRGEFDVAGEGADIRFGFHRLRSHSVFPIETCPIHDVRIERAVFAFREAIVELGVTGVQNLLVTVEPRGNGLLWTLRLRDRRRALPHEFAPMVAAKLPDLVLLDDTMHLEFWGLHFRVRNDTFVQTNYGQMLELYRVALEMLGSAAPPAVLDLYCGIGALTLPIAGVAGRVTGVESNARAVRLAQLAARINSVAGVNFINGVVEEALASIRIGEYAAAVLDPPRAGCEPAALAQIIRLGLDRLVYISCEPATHARDIAALVRGGYRVRRVALVDMFPQTYHVESVALLER